MGGAGQDGRAGNFLGSGWALVGGEQLHVTSLTLYILLSLSLLFIAIIYPSFSVLLKGFYLNPRVFTIFLILSLIPLGALSKQLCGAALPAMLNHSSFGVVALEMATSHSCSHPPFGISSTVWNLAAFAKTWAQGQPWGLWQYHAPSCMTTRLHFC